MTDLPMADRGRFITFADIARATETPVDTVVSWHRFIRAMGYGFGRKTRHLWNFSPHEFYVVNLIGALSRSGFPAHPEALRQVLEASAEPRRPDRMIVLRQPSTFAVIAVDAPRVWDTVAHMLARMEKYDA